jgi:hypothetical protein
MSKKRLIDWDSFCRFITSIEMPTQYTSSETNQLKKKAGKYWDGLPKPTLADVCGTRALDSMTEEEINELVELYAGNPVDIKLAPRDNNKSIYVEYVECEIRRTLHIYLGELSVGGKEVKIFKWFIKNGFNVLGDI